MSEDTAHGQHFEPVPPTPSNGAAGAQCKPLTQEEILVSQAHTVSELGLRVRSLLNAVSDAYEQFLFEITLFNELLAKTGAENNANRPTNGTATQA